MIIEGALWCTKVRYDSAALVQLSLFVWLFIWLLEDFHFYVFFTVLALWAIADGIWIVNVSSMLLIRGFPPKFEYNYLMCLVGFLGNVLSSNEEPAFANFALWLTIGVSAAYFGGNFICVYIQLYVLMAALCLGLAGYFTAEIIDKKIKLTDI